MLTAFAELWRFDTDGQTDTAPEPMRRSGPVLMGDILIAPRDEPELLRRWRADASADDQP